MNQNPEELVNQDLAAVLGLDLRDAGIELLAAGRYQAKIASVNVIPNRREDGMVLHLTLELQDVTLRDGARLPFYVLEDWISLKRTDRYDPARRLAELNVAALGRAGQKFVPADLMGKTVAVMVIVEDGDFGPRNRIRRYMPAAPMP